MDNWNAPQWADFNASVRSDIDEYFNYEHKELNSVRANLTPYASFTESPSSKASTSISSYDTPKSNGFASPHVTMGSRSSNSRSTRSSGLTLAMASLKIKSASKSLGRQSMTPGALRIKTVNAEAVKLRYDAESDDGTETDVEQPRTIDGGEAPEALRPETSPQTKRGDSLSEENVEDEHADNNATMIASAADTDNSICEAVEKIDKPEHDNLIKPQTIAKTSVTKDAKEATKLVSAKRVNENVGQPNANEKNSQAERSQPKRRCEPSKIADNKNLEKFKPHRARVLTSQARRQSIVKYRRRSAQYVSLAEAVSRFQNATPERFRSANHKDNKSGPLQKMKQTTVKLTRPMSPALRCKYRTRAIPSTNQESQTRGNAIVKPSSANPKPSTNITAKSASFPRALPSAREKSATTVKPPRKVEKIPSASSSMADQKTAMGPPKTAPKPAAPKVPSILKKIDKILGESICAKDASIMSTSIMSESVRNRHTPCKKTVPTVVSTDDGTSLKDVEILHFGIPVGNDHKKITRTVPFSFETRNKEMKNKKDQLKNQQQEAENLKKTTFHARPAPSFNAPAKKISSLKNKDNVANKENNSGRTLTFKERNEMAMKKKKELLDQIVEQEKKARVFHAKPAPNFKPVFVRGNSTENLRNLGCDAAKGRTRGISPVGRQNGADHKSGNQENKAPNFGNQQCPKLKDPLVAQNLKIKKTAM